MKKNIQNSAINAKCFQSVRYVFRSEVNLQTGVVLYLKLMKTQ